FSAELKIKSKLSMMFTSGQAGAQRCCARTKRCWLRAEIVPGRTEGTRQSKAKQAQQAFTPGQSWGAAGCAPTKEKTRSLDLRGERGFEEGGGFGAFDAVGGGVEDAAAEVLRAVEGEPVGEM